MTLTINRDSYIDLLNQYEISPKIIETQQEYDQFLAVTNPTIKAILLSERLRQLDKKSLQE